jgi:ComF family protein
VIDINPTPDGMETEERNQPWTNRLLDQLVPRHCVLCGLFSGHENLCPPCTAELPHNPAACVRCGLPLPAQPESVCGACLTKPPAWDEAVAGLRYQSPADQLVCQFKYNRNLACGQVLGGILLEAINLRGGRLPQAIVPVPLHRHRLFARTFNQAHMLARQLSRTLEIPVMHNVLTRTRKTSAQFGLDALQRRKNIRGAFACRRHGLKQIAIVDDVMTTGTTLTECTRSLKRAGAESVTAWVAARAVYD